MKAETKEKRLNEILDIAVEVLSERGYRDTTMLQVARRASASKETLYAWFGDKQGLFEAVIRRNAETLQTVLRRHLDDDGPLQVALEHFGEELLQVLLSESAVAVNRAAISEARSDPQLARILSETGREATLPIFVAFLNRRKRHGELRFDGAAEAAQDFLGLLLGDLPTRRHLGLTPAPGKRSIARRSKRATRHFLRLHG